MTGWVGIWPSNILHVIATKRKKTTGPLVAISRFLSASKASACWSQNNCILAVSIQLNQICRSACRYKFWINTKLEPTLTHSIHQVCRHFSTVWCPFLYSASSVTYEGNRQNSWYNKTSLLWFCDKQKEFFYSGWWVLPGTFEYLSLWIFWLSDVVKIFR